MRFAVLVFLGLAACNRGVDPRAVNLEPRNQILCEHDSTIRARRLRVGDESFDNSPFVSRQRRVITVNEVEDRRLVSVTERMALSEVELLGGLDAGDDEGQEVLAKPDGHFWTRALTRGGAAEDWDASHPLRHDLLPSEKVKAGQEYHLDSSELGSAFGGEPGDQTLGQGTFVVQSIKDGKLTATLKATVETGDDRGRLKFDGSGKLTLDTETGLLDVELEGETQFAGLEEGVRIEIDGPLQERSTCRLCTGACDAPRVQRRPRR